MYRLTLDLSRTAGWSGGQNQCVNIAKAKHTTLGQCVRSLAVRESFYWKETPLLRFADTIHASAIGSRLTNCLSWLTECFRRTIFSILTIFQISRRQGTFKQALLTLPSSAIGRMIFARSFSRPQILAQCGRRLRTTCA
jgi:hypothetical protein